MFPYKIIEYNKMKITLQVSNKASFFYVSWQEFFLPDYICFVDKKDIFLLGIYYIKNLRNFNLYSILNNDSELHIIKKTILLETIDNNFVLMDINTQKCETISLDFLIDNLDLLENFTSIQSFFLGTRAGIINEITLNFKG